jgi:hypothetical protein
MANSYYDDVDWTLLSFDDPKPKLSVVLPSGKTYSAEGPDYRPQKGVCPKCGKHVGKGSYIHIKACNGHSDQA